MGEAIGLLSQTGDLINTSNSGRALGTKAKDLKGLSDDLLKAGLPKEDIEKIISSGEGSDFSALLQGLLNISQEKVDFSQEFFSGGTSDSLGQILGRIGLDSDNKGVSLLGLLMKGDLPREVYDRIWTQMDGVSDGKIEMKNKGEIAEKEAGRDLLNSLFSLLKDLSGPVSNSKESIYPKTFSDRGAGSSLGLAGMIQSGKRSISDSDRSSLLDELLSTRESAASLGLDTIRQHGVLRNEISVQGGKFIDSDDSKASELLQRPVFQGKLGDENIFSRSLTGLDWQDNAQASEIGDKTGIDATRMTLSNFSKISESVFNRHSIAVELLNKVEHAVKQSVIMNKIPGGVRISLNPPELGHLKIDLSYEGHDNLKVHILADKPVAYEILKDSSHSLKEHLVENTHFMDVKVELSHTPRSEHQGMWFEDRNRRRPGEFVWDKKENSADDGEFSDVLEGVINRLV